MSAKEERFDIIVIPDRPDMRVTDQFGASVIQNLGARRIIRPVDEALHKDWVEVYCEPGPSAHEAFVKGGWDDDRPPYLEAVVRWGQTPVDVIDGGQLQSYFFVEFRGALFDDVGGRFRKVFQDVTKLRPRTLSKPHTELPPHREVPKGEERTELNRRKRVGNPSGQAGTSVEEW